MKKWRHIRDNYYRTLRKNTGRRYIYHRQLFFLKPTKKSTVNSQAQSVKIESHSSVSDSDSENGFPQETTEQPESPSYSDGSSKRQKRDSKSPLNVFWETPIPIEPSPEPNPDRSFFESILPLISNFTEDQQLEFRGEVLSIIKRIRRSSHN